MVVVYMVVKMGINVIKVYFYVFWEGVIILIVIFIL